MLYNIQSFPLLIDDEDYPRLIQHNWYCSNRKYPYFEARINGKRIRLHRFILGVDDSVEIVDHINLNKLDNRKSNLRPCSKSENNKNVGIRRDNTTGYKGITFHKKSGKYLAQISHNRKRIYIGLFLSPEDAFEAYRNKAREIHKDYCSV